MQNVEKEKDHLDSIIEYARRSGASQEELEEMKKEVEMLRAKPGYKPSDYFFEDMPFQDLENTFENIECSTVRGKLQRDLRRAKSIAEGKESIDDFVEDKNGKKGISYQKWRNPSISIPEQFRLEEEKIKRKHKLVLWGLNITFVVFCVFLVNILGR